MGQLLIVRFAPVRVDKLIEAAEDSYAECLRRGEQPVYSISTFGLLRTDEAQSVEDMVDQICREAPCGGRNVWLATADALAGEGFEVKLSEPPPRHYDVVLGDVLSTPDVDRLVAVLATGRRRNPTWKS